MSVATAPVLAPPAGAERASSWGATASLLTIATVVLSLGNYGYSFLVVHLMGARDFARFSAAQGLMLVLGSGCMAAIPWAMARFIAERPDRRSRQVATHFGLIASALQGLVFAAVAGVILWRTAGLGVGVMVAISAFVGSMIAVPMGFLQGLDRLRAITAIRVLEFVVRFGSGILILLCVSRSATAALVGYPIGAAVLVGAGLWLCRSGLPPVSGEGETIRALARQSASLGAIQVFLSMLGALDTVAALAAHLGTDPTASYQSAALLGRIPLFLSAAIGLAAYVRVVNAGTDAEVREKLGQAARLYSIVVIPFVIACVTVPDSLVHLLIPARYGDAATLLRFTAISGAAVGWIDVVSTAHQARGRFRSAIVILGIAAVAQPVALIVAGQVAGVWVFASALVSVSVLAAVALSFDARLWLLRRFSPRGVIVAVAALAAGLLLHRSPPAWISLITLLAAERLWALAVEVRQTSAPADVNPADVNPADIESADIESAGIESAERALRAPGEESPEASAQPFPTETETETETDVDAETGTGPRILIVGDSVAHGLGVRGRSFGRVAAAELGAEDVLDLSAVSRTVSDTLELADHIRDFGPELAILCVGGTESLVHPTPAVQRVIERWGPASLKGLAGLQPRPYFTGNARQRLGQRFTSAAKTQIKKIALRLGGQRRIPLEHVRESVDGLLELLEGLSCPMVFVGMWRVDERLFPGTGAELDANHRMLETALRGRSDATLVDIYDRMDYWDDFLWDNLHFNAEGHLRVARLVVAASRPLTRSPRVEVLAATAVG